MIDASLQQFCNHAVTARRLTADDVRTLVRDVLPDGIGNREDADMLIALERAVPSSDPTFAAWLCAAVIDFVVWGERPTGYVEAETAAWLAATIAGRDGPSSLGARIAMEVVREAQGSAEALMVFALEANRWIREPAPARRPRFALAA